MKTEHRFVCDSCKKIILQHPQLCMSLLIETINFQKRWTKFYNDHKMCMIINIIIIFSSHNCNSLIYVNLSSQILMLNFRWLSFVIKLSSVKLRAAFTVLHIEFQSIVRRFIVSQFYAQSTLSSNFHFNMVDKLRYIWSGLYLTEIL